MEPSSERPTGVAILALLAGFSGAVGLGLAFVGASAGLGVGLIAAVLAAISLVWAVGAWQLRRWAWPLGMTLWILALVDALGQLTTNQFSTNLVVAPICLLYLIQPAVRVAFRR